LKNSTRAIAPAQYSRRSQASKFELLDRAGSGLASERELERIELAKARSVYLGRKPGIDSFNIRLRACSLPGCL